MTRLESGLMDFIRRYEHVVTNALQIHIREMGKVAEETQAGYDQIKDDPELTAKQDQTVITTNGLLQSARMFRESQALSQDALEAFEKLCEMAEEP